MIQKPMLWRLPAFKLLLLTLPRPFGESQHGPTHRAGFWVHKTPKTKAFLTRWPLPRPFATWRSRLEPNRFSSHPVRWYAQASLRPSPWSPLEGVPSHIRYLASKKGTATPLSSPLLPERRQAASKATATTFETTYFRKCFLAKTQTPWIRPAMFNSFSRYLCSRRSEVHSLGTPSSIKV